MKIFQLILVYSCLFLLGCGLFEKEDKKKDEPPPTVEDTESTVKEVPALSLVLEKHCVSCHGAETNAGGFGFADNLNTLSQSPLVRAGDPNASSLYLRVANDSMPPGEVKLTPGEKVAIRDWIQGGAHGEPMVSPPVEFIKDDLVIELIRADQQSNPGSESYLYFVLHQVINGIGTEEADAIRMGVTKLINMLSTAPEIVIPTALGESRAVLRVDAELLGWKKESWRTLVNEAASYSNISLYRRLQELLGGQRAVPGEWFLGVAAKAPHYYSFLQVPSHLFLLEKRLGLNAERNLAEGQVMRAGFTNSAVADHHRIIERHQGAAGRPYWRSYEFGSVTSRKNVLANPLGPVELKSIDPVPAILPFDADGHEVIFGLPNGLLGFAVYSGDGVRMASAPGSTKALEAGARVFPGLTCMTCHAGGVIPKADQVRPSLLADPLPGAQEAILQIYTEVDAMTARFEQDNAPYHLGLQRLGVTTSVENEPVSGGFQLYQSDLSIDYLAAYFGYTADEFRGRVAENGSREWRAVLIAGTMTRAAFETALLDPTVGKLAD